MKNGKLVRDRIPEIIKNNGEEPKTRILKDAEYRQALLEKLVEESRELCEDPTLEERADVAEVLIAIDKIMNFSAKSIENERQQKHQKRGGFKKRIFLKNK